MRGWRLGGVIANRPYLSNVGLLQSGYALVEVQPSDSRHLVSVYQFQSSNGHIMVTRRDQTRQE
jgi:hypothetical protein